MEKRRPKGREKHVLGGSAEVHKQEGSQQGFGGPVGNNGNFQGRKNALSGSNNGTRQGQTQNGRNVKRTVTRGGLGTVGTILLIFLALKLFNCGGSSSSLLGSLTNSTTTNSTDSYQSSSSAVSLEDILGSYYSQIQESTATQSELVEAENSATADTLSGVQPATTVSTTVSNQARDKYTKILGNGNDTVTIMVYMCGTDLESNYGMATSDLVEMQNATISDKVNVIVETGGCKYWRNSIISSNSNEIYQVMSGKIKRLEDNVGNKCMTDSSTLVEFINYCKSNFPANRYCLIMWDHGGGSLSGYGYDELFTSKGSMALDVFSSALNQTGVKFDFIGFDACLMATLETDVVATKYADYMIGSEETEPGTGWYYTNWLTTLSKNTSTPTVDVAKVIIDDFITTSAKSDSTAETTLSCVDLAEFSGTVPEALSNFASNTNNLLSGNNYQQIAEARSDCKEFSASSMLNQIDLIDFADEVGTTEAKNLVSTLQGCVKYNRTSNTMKDAYGISAYFPYQTLSGVSNMLEIYDNIGMDDNYSNCVKNFASLISGGQITAASSGYGSMSSILESLMGSYGSGYSTGYDTSSYGDLGSLLGGSSYGSGYGNSYGSSSYGDLGSLLGGNSTYGSYSGSTSDVSSLLNSFLGSGDFSSLLGGRSADWVNKDLIKKNVQNIANNTLTSDKFIYSVVNGQKILTMAEEDWEKIDNIQLSVFLDDGEGYIDLGLDPVFEYTDNGDLILEYDNTWLTWNGMVVPYYFISETYSGQEYSIRGYIPAMINDKRSEIIVVFDNENPNGVVAGCQWVEGLEDEKTIGKSFELMEGDVIEFLCDYYDYTYTFQDNYILDTMVYSDKNIFGNMEISNGTLIASYKLTDIYQNSYWTPQL